MLKRQLAFFFSSILVLSLTISSCTQNPDGSDISDISSVESSLVSQAVSETSEKEDEYVFGKPVSSKLNINSGNFVPVKDYDEKFIVKKNSGYTYLDIFSPEISITGFPSLEENGGELYRLRLSDTSKYTANNNWLAWSTAGGKVRFRTDATTLNISITLQKSNSGMKHFADTGSVGLDVYVGTGTARTYVKTIQPTTEPTYSGLVYLQPGVKEVMINLPTYSGVKSMSIGFPDNSKVAEPLPFTYEKPIAFYGSSITQGGCSSRPGTTYFNILGRALDANTLNLGFSGSAFGETAIAEYIASVDISAFIFDYDYNADTPEKLGETHYPFYEIVRAAHPDIPIIFVSRCNYNVANTNDVKCRLLIIKNYEKAKEAGDENVYFVDGSKFFGKYNPADYTVDGLHPTDLGFRMMAEHIFPVLKEALEK